MPILQGPRGPGGDGKIRLAYCTNVHAGETLEEIEATLARHAVSVRRQATPDRALGVGLWLAAPVARALAESRDLAQRLRERLTSLGLVAFTANAFPYGGFHAARVKEAVYRPSWLEEERARYTLDVATALATLLPFGESTATVSTLPIAWARDVADPREARRQAAQRLAKMAGELAALRDRTRASVRLCVEPEPGCIIETTDEAIALFAEIRAVRGVPAGAIGAHLGVCFDCCHQAVMGEDLPASLARLRAAGVPIGKVHLSSAVEGTIADLAPLAEPRYLHQVVCDCGKRADDLETIARDPAWQAERGRCHFHVPIYAERLSMGLATTRPALLAALGSVLDAAATGREPAPDLEVETYTWGVLPESERPAELADGIAREMKWALERLLERGYKPC